MPNETRLRDVEEAIDNQAHREPGFAIAYALLRIADAQESVAVQLKYLGNGDAATTMGAIEAFGMHIGQRIDHLTEVLGNALENLAEAVTPEAPDTPDTLDR